MIKHYKDKKVYVCFITVLFLLSITSRNITHAYFNHTQYNNNISINLGTWSWSSDIIDIAPDGTINLDEWVSNNTLNSTMPYSTYFVYNNQLHQVTTSKGYNPLWHGIPYSGSGGEGWAFINLSLEWAGASQRYTVGAIVKTDDGRFFQAMHAGNTKDPRTHNGPTMPYSSGEPWREIMPMEDYMFNMLPNSSLRDYTSPIAVYVIEKY